MNIYKIVSDKFEYGCNFAHVIVANSPKEVVELAKENKHDEEDDERWNNGIIENVGVYTGENKLPFISLTEYING